MSTYAIINDRGHQYKVSAGDRLLVDLLAEAKEGAGVTFGEVLLVGTDNDVKVGTPKVAGAKVTGTVEEIVKGEKVIANRRVWTNSINIRHGHRKKYSLIKIDKIEG